MRERGEVRKRDEREGERVRRVRLRMLKSKGLGNMVARSEGSSANDI